MKTDSGIFREGTYEWNITFLTLMYDDKAEKFGFKFATGISLGYGYILQSDKQQNISNDILTPVSQK